MEMKSTMLLNEEKLEDDLKSRLRKVSESVVGDIYDIFKVIIYMKC